MIAMTRHLFIEKEVNSITPSHFIACHVYEKPTISNFHICDQRIYIISIYLNYLYLYRVGKVDLQLYI